MRLNCAGLSDASFCWSAELGSSAGGTAIKSIAVAKMQSTELKGQECLTNNGRF